MRIIGNADSSAVVGFPPTFMYGTVEDRGSQGSMLKMNTRLYRAGIQVFQNGTSSFTRNGKRTGIRIDCGFKKHDNVSGSLSQHHFTNNDNEVTYQENILRDNFDNKVSDTSTICNAENNFTDYSIDWSLNYKNTFKNEKQKLSVSYNTSYSTNTSYYIQTQVTLPQLQYSVGSNSNNPLKNTESQLQ